MMIVGGVSFAKRKCEGDVTCASKIFRRTVVNQNFKLWL
jgi:hypothetical protein